MASTGSDGGLRPLFRTHMPSAQWTTIETGSVSGGVPDSEFCFDGAVQGWMEYKACRTGWAVRVRPAQVAWLARRARYGGRCWVAVRRLGGGSCDELWLFPGAAAGALKEGGLQGSAQYRVGYWYGGPAQWNWAQIEETIRS